MFSQRLYLNMDNPPVPLHYSNILSTVIVRKHDKFSRESELQSRSPVAVTLNEQIVVDVKI